MTTSEDKVKGKVLQRAHTRLNPLMHMHCYCGDHMHDRPRTFDVLTIQYYCTV